MVEGSVAAGGRGAGPGRRQYRDTDPGRPTVGSDFCVRLVGIENAGRGGRGCGGVALLADGWECRRAASERSYGYYLGDGFRNHPGRVDGRRDGWAVRAGVARTGKVAGGGGRWRSDAGLRRPHRLRLQYRRVFQRDRLVQCPWLAVVCRGVCGQRGRYADAPILRATGLTDAKPNESLYIPPTAGKRRASSLRRRSRGRTAASADRAIAADADGFDCGVV